MDGEYASSNKPAASLGRPPVILQVVPSLVTGGVERGCIDVAQAIAQAGGIGVVASAGGPMARELERWNVPHVTLPLSSKNPWTIWRNAARLAEVIRHYDVDIVHARSRAPAWSALWAARRTDRHFMTTFHAPYNFKSALKRRYNSVMARGERIIAISSFIRDHILQNYAVDPAIVRVIPRGIDLGAYAPDRVARHRLADLATRWRLPDDRPIILLPGRLTRWKGQMVMLEALAKLGRRDLCCLFVGSDQGRIAYRQELMARIAELGLDDVVHLVDECHDMPAAYMLANVVVSASTEPEAFGRVIVEAQAMGRPVIVTDHGAVAETVDPGVTAWVVPPGDSASLAEALAQALAIDDDQRAILGARGMAHVAMRFTKERMTGDTLSVYTELLAETTRL
ncbi:MAG: glycosyltransferase family 4 protein [Azospirillaceae bacterium]|nr:glycosyltransferase family 4 protein [Azospirillaceae bacterium]